MGSSGFRQVRRFEQVFATLVKYELGFLVKSTFKKPVNSKIGEPEVVRKILEELGGTFVKMGQFLSLRPDLIPPKYCEELARLQDNVKPFSFEKVKEIVELSSGKKLNSAFSSFGKMPIASASIGQVHKGKLKSADSVAIKVRRPGIVELMNTDMDILAALAKIIKKHVDNDIIDPEGIVEELKDYTEKEINYLNETAKITKFYQIFENSEVVIPKVYKDLCSEKVMVMEFIEGRKLSEFMDEKTPLEKRKELTDAIVNAFFKQVFEDGYFHADPHPGNILVLDQKLYPGKKVAFLDFGITGALDEEVKQSLVDLFVALIDKDIEKIITAMSELHLIDSESLELKRDMRNMLGPYYGVALRNIDVPKLFIQSMKVAKRNKVKVPKDYVLLGKALITLESVCGKMNPEFNLVESSKPFVAKMMLRRYSPKKFALSGLKKMSRVKNLVEEMPGLAKKYVEKNIEQERELKELSIHMNSLESEIRNVADRFVMVGAVMVLLIAGLLFYKYPPFYNGIPVISGILFVIALFLLAVTVFKKNH